VVNILPHIGAGNLVQNMQLLVWTWEQTEIIDKVWIYVCLGILKKGVLSERCITLVTTM
jgi:hypothetical protein